MAKSTKSVPNIEFIASLGYQQVPGLKMGSDAFNDEDHLKKISLAGLRKFLVSEEFSEKFFTRKKGQK